MAAPAGAFTQTDEARAKISQASRQQWKDPQVRKLRSQRMREAWARKKAGLDICPTCGQHIPLDELSRD